MRADSVHHVTLCVCICVCGWMSVIECGTPSPSFSSRPRQHASHDAPVSILALAWLGWAVGAVSVSACQKSLTLSTPCQDPWGAHALLPLLPPPIIPIMTFHQILLRLDVIG